LAGTCLATQRHVRSLAGCLHQWRSLRRGRRSRLMAARMAAGEVGPTASGCAISWFSSRFASVSSSESSAGASWSMSWAPHSEASGVQGNNRRSVGWPYLSALCRSSTLTRPRAYLHRQNMVEGIELMREDPADAVLILVRFDRNSTAPPMRHRDPRAGEAGDVTAASVPWAAHGCLP
jgi:hypothetical protein